MLITKAMLRVHEVASVEDCRPTLNSVYFTKDGAAVATDGHVMLEVRETVREDAADFPSLDGLKSVDLDDAGMIIPAAACKAALRNAPKRSRLPILEHVLLARNGSDSHAVLASTDLDSTKREDFRPIEGPYPDYGRVYPDPDGEVVLTVGFSPRVLADFFKTVADIMGDKGESYAMPVVLTFHKRADKDGSYLGPVVVRGSAGNVSIKGLIMPKRVS